jgi:hypothetical protein
MRIKLDTFKSFLFSMTNFEFVNFGYIRYFLLCKYSIGISDANHWNLHILLNIEKVYKLSTHFPLFKVCQVLIFMPSGLTIVQYQMSNYLILICVNLVEHTHGSFNCMRITVTLPDVHPIIQHRLKTPKCDYETVLMNKLYHKECIEKDSKTTFKPLMGIAELQEAVCESFNRAAVGECAVYHWLCHDQDKEENEYVNGWLRYWDSKLKGYDQVNIRKCHGYTHAVEGTVRMFYR